MSGRGLVWHTEGGAPCCLTWNAGLGDRNFSLSTRNGFLIQWIVCVLMFEYLTLFNLIVGCFFGKCIPTVLNSLDIDLCHFKLICDHRQTNWTERLWISLLNVKYGNSYHDIAAECGCFFYLIYSGFIGRCTKRYAAPSVKHSEK